VTLEWPALVLESYYLNSVKMGNYFKDLEEIEHGQRGKHISLLGFKIMSSDN